MSKINKKKKKKKKKNSFGKKFFKFHAKIFISPM